ncbi:MAG TPA: branched-chain amino acid ABC transporter permease [Stellaceae bacterium]|nr:branched-chain amino acid ABC transporter permease [Stellaceae bacterium]
MLSPILLLQFLVSGIGVGCVYGLIGIGFCVIYNASGIVNFAQGGFVMLGGMVTYVLYAQAGLALLPAAVIAVILVAAFGLVVDRLVVRPLWSRKANTFVIILATLAVQIVLERATLLLVGDAPKSLPAFTAGGPLRLGPVAVSLQLLWIVAISLLLIAGLSLFFSRTRTGRAMRACAVDPQAAALLGVPVSRMLAYAFSISAGLGAIAGILITPTQFVAYNLGVPFAISGFIAAIVGGFGNPLGAFLGGILLGVTQSLAIVMVGAGYKNVVALSILLLFLLLRPAGILGARKA